MRQSFNVAGSLRQLHDVVQHYQQPGCGALVRRRNVLGGLLAALQILSELGILRRYQQRSRQLRRMQREVSSAPTRASPMLSGRLCTV
jgi:hypothetical protein